MFSYQFPSRRRMKERSRWTGRWRRTPWNCVCSLRSGLSGTTRWRRVELVNVRACRCLPIMTKIHYTRFPVDGEVADLKLATSRCNGIWETTRHNRHNGPTPAPTCCGLIVYVADLLRTCYGETGVCFGLNPSPESIRHSNHQAPADELKATLSLP